MSMTPEGATDLLPARDGSSSKYCCRQATEKTTKNEDVVRILKFPAIRKDGCDFGEPDDAAYSSMWVPAVIFQKDIASNHVLS